MREESLTKSILLVMTFFTLTPIALFTSIFTLVTLSHASASNPEILGTRVENFNLISSPKTGVQVYASLPDTSSSLTLKVRVEDARAEIIRQYLLRYESPLAPYSDYIVETADEYGLDFRLTTAIAQQESNLCKKIPPESNNCWGWGIHSEGTLGFDNYKRAIEEVTKGLRKDYLDKGLTSIEEIMAKYTPLSNGSWAEGVNKFMDDME
jgi:hypothetical protein